MDKALGSDGFTGRFYKSCWNVIKGDLLMALDAIYRGHACDTPTTTEEAVSLSDEVILHMKDWRGKAGSTAMGSKDEFEDHKPGVS